MRNVASLQIVQGAQLIGATPLDVGKGPDTATLVLKNLSGYDLIVAFGGVASTTMPAHEGDRFDVATFGGFSGLITVTPAATQPSNAANAPTQMLYVIGYQAGEPVPGVYPVHYDRLANVGNTVNTGNSVTQTQSIIYDQTAINGEVASSVKSTAASGGAAPLVDVTDANPTGGKRKFVQATGETDINGDGSITTPTVNTIKIADSGSNYAFGPGVETASSARGFGVVVWDGAAAHGLQIIDGSGNFKPPVPAANVQNGILGGAGDYTFPANVDLAAAKRVNLGGKTGTTSAANFLGEGVFGTETDVELYNVGSNALTLGSDANAWMKINNYFDGTNDRFLLASTAAYQFHWRSDGNLEWRASAGTGAAGGIITWQAFAPLPRNNSAGGGAAGNQTWYGTTDPGVAAGEGDQWIGI